MKSYGKGVDPGRPSVEAIRTFVLSIRDSSNWAIVFR